ESGKHTAYCYTNDPPKPLPMFKHCDKMECCTVEPPLSPTKLDKINAEPIEPIEPQGIELDKTDNNKWILTIARSRKDIATPDDTCTFSIG
ncbi:hypothetical protein PMAYCL1PPCAC_19705, partial [Pristionchus mayeri]